MVTEPDQYAALIVSVHHLTVAIRMMEETLKQLVVELHEPPSSELPELLRALIAQSLNTNLQLLASTKSLETMAGAMGQIGARVAELRDQIIATRS